MLNTVKNVMHRLDGAGDLAKDLIHRLDGAGDLAKRMGGSSAQIAKTVGVSSVALAKKVGVKRGLAGFAILGAAAVGGILLARYLKNRRVIEESIEESMAASDAAAGEPSPAESVRRRRLSRAKRKAQQAHQ